MLVGSSVIVFTLLTMLFSSAPFNRCHPDPAKRERDLLTAHLTDSIKENRASAVPSR